MFCVTEKKYIKEVIYNGLYKLSLKEVKKLVSSGGEVLIKTKAL
jgi:hypothetical protein